MIDRAAVGERMAVIEFAFFHRQRSGTGVYCTTGQLCSQAGYESAVLDTCGFSARIVMAERAAAIFAAAIQAVYTCDVHCAAVDADRAALLRAAAGEGCAVITLIIRRVVDRQACCVNRAAVGGLRCSFNNTVDKLDRSLTLLRVIAAVDDHCRGVLTRCADRTAAGFAAMSILQRRTGINYDRTLLSRDQFVIARRCGLVLASVEGDVLKLEDSVFRIHAEQRILAVGTVDGADRAFRAAVGVLGVGLGGRSQGDVSGGEVGDRGFLSDGIVLHQHLDIDRLAACDRRELINSRLQLQVDGVPAVGAFEGVAFRIRDLADIEAPMDIEVICTLVAVQFAIPVVKEGVQEVAACVAVVVGAKGLAVLAVVCIGIVGIGHIDADFRPGAEADARGIDDRVAVDLHENVMVVGFGAGRIALHLHVALEVQFACVNGLDRAAVGAGDCVAGDLEIAGEGRRIADIDRAAAHRLTAGDAAAGDGCTCDPCVQIHAAAVAVRRGAVASRRAAVDCTALD